MKKAEELNSHSMKNQADVVAQEAVRQAHIALRCCWLVISEDQDLMHSDVGPP